MPDVLIISAVFPPEPVVSAKLSFDIASALAQINSVTVISPRPSRPFGFHFTEKKDSRNLHHIVANSFIHPSSGITGRFRESYSFGKYCLKYIAENSQNIDVIYANTWPLLGQYFVVKAARKYKVPVVIHVQDIYPESLSKKLPLAASLFKGLLMPLDKYILRNANHVIAISKTMKDYLEKSRKLNGDKISVIPNWQDSASFLNYREQDLQENAKPFTFMYLGNIGPVAGVDLLLKAFAKANLKDTRLVIAGAGSMKEKLAKDAKKFSESNIEFLPVAEGKVPEIQSVADVLMLPIKRGNASTSIPSKLPAYMFSAKPIIASVDEDSDTAAAIKLAKCGYVIEPENVDLLSTVMKQVYNLKESEIENLGMNGRNYALLNFSKKSNLQKVLSLIEKLINGN